MPEESHPTPPSRVSAVVVAAGSGSRMGATTSKLLLSIRGEPVIRHALRSLAESGAVDELVLVTRPGDRAEMLAIARPAAGGIPLRTADGGAERADSVASGVAAVSEDAGWILIHDGARPLASPALVRSLLDAARRSGAAIPALPLVDTVKRVRDGRVVETVDRADLVGAQTPQAFRADLLRAAVLSHRARSHAPTDDAALFEALGLPVAVVPGDPFNLKITRPEDLVLADALLARVRPEGLRA